ncbi:MAG TPA: efflux RND transporter periplasmic adaptor subunit [Bacteroidales bacterium]|nr:efflux RND transporter periplasmic adaptor subunit [Bacteroidales bacterium]HRT13691.1 efflux RND transporter periplasmic adaptor subunit [Bacteroidales bacterium]
MKKNIFLSFVLISFSLILFNSCSSKKKYELQTTTANDTIAVTLSTVHLQKVDQLYEYTALIQANALNHIAPTIPGRIDKIYFEVGDEVKKGDKLVQMDANNLSQAKTQLDNLELSFSRIDALYQTGGVSKAEWDAQKTALEVARTSYENLLTNTQLLSPINGIITMRNYDSGDIFAGNPILQVQEIKPVKILINVSENQYLQVKKGMNAKVYVDVFKDEVFNGKVNLVYPTIDPRTHTFPVEITIPNLNQRIRPGMYARVELNYGVKENVVVPDIAIIKQQGADEHYVFIYKEGKAHYKRVNLGRRMDSNYAVLSGVEDGDQVITSSLHRLNDGMSVTIIEN